jgi:hypothetical protein
MDNEVMAVVRLLITAVNDQDGEEFVTGHGRSVRQSHIHGTLDRAQPEGRCEYDRFEGW